MCWPKPDLQHRGKCAAPGVAAPLAGKLGPGALRFRLKFKALNMGALRFPLMSSSTNILMLFYSQCSGMKGYLLLRNFGKVEKVLGFGKKGIRDKTRTFHFQYFSVTFLI